MRYKGFHLVGSNKSCYHFVGSHKCEDPRSGSKTHFYIYWKKKFNKGQRYVVVELDTIGPRIKFKIREEIFTRILNNFEISHKYLLCQAT